MEKKVKSVTFFRHDCLDQEELVKFTDRMLKVLLSMKLKSGKEVVIKRGESAGMELWLHDFQNNDKPLQPFRTYYVVEYADGSMRVTLMLDDVPAQCPHGGQGHEAKHQFDNAPPKVEMFG